MDDKNTNPDSTPQDAAPSAPDAHTVPLTPADEAPQTAPTAQTTAAPAEPAPAATPRRRRALLIGGGIAAAVLLVGGGVAVGAAIADEIGDDDDRPSLSDEHHDDHDDRPGAGQDDRRDDDRDDAGPQGPGQGSGAAVGSDSADEIVDIADAARGAAEGEVTSIDAKRDGAWEVQLVTAAGDETEVRVDSDLRATVVSSEKADDDDTAPALTLDAETIRALVAAALDEADGLITDLDVDDDASSPYDATVLTDDRRSIDIDFSADFAVVGTDIDD